MEKLQALSTLLESLTFDSTAVFEYARPVIFLPLLIPLVKLDQEGGGWELGGEIAFQATRFTPRFDISFSISHSKLLCVDLIKVFRTLSGVVTRIIVRDDSEVWWYSVVSKMVVIIRADRVCGVSCYNIGICGQTTAFIVGE